MRPYWQPVAPLVSVLLPTRNRLELLRHAIESVRRQDDPDWELIVSDNDSEEDIAGFVAGLADNRIRCVRTPSFIPVTGNWNTALREATGRYVVMLGDDDALMAGHVARIRQLANRFDEPDAIYHGAWLFAYPGVFDDEPAGYVQPYGYAKFLRGATEPFVLDHAVARRMVKAAMTFRVRYGFNMQFWAVHRDTIARLSDKGPFYQSQFPDYYASNVLLLTARAVVAEPRPLVAIGVSPKSYGFFHATGDETGGKDFLEARAREERRPSAAEMPGTNINTGWLSAIETIAARYPDLIPASPALRRFRFLQADFVYEGRYLRGDTSAEQLETLERYLTPWERRTGRLAMRICVLAKRLLPERLTRAFSNTFHHLVVHQFSAWNPPKVRGEHATILELFERPPEAHPPDPGPRGPFQRLRRTTV